MQQENEKTQHDNRTMKHHVFVDYRRAVLD